MTLSGFDKGGGVRSVGGAKDRREREVRSVEAREIVRGGRVVVCRRSSKDLEV